jgi:hypothetical protein
MMEISESEASIGPRDIDLEQHIRDVEKAAADWGVHTDALEGRFVAALMAAIAASGRGNRATLGDIETLMDKTRATGEGELRRVRMLIESGQKTLDMARQAALTAVAAGDRAEKEFNTSVSKIATELSRKLLAESQQWLVLKQSARNRRDAWRLAISVSLAALALFVGGYVTAEWRKGADRAADQAVLAAIQQCWMRPIMVRDAKGQETEMCRLADIDPQGR